jgi:hypothetical protein
MVFLQAVGFTLVAAAFVGLMMAASVLMTKIFTKDGKLR